MPIEDFFVHPVTIVEPGITIDRYGDDRPDWDMAFETDTQAWVYDLTNLEVLGDRDTNVLTKKLRLPASSPITAASRLIIDGNTYEVDGEPRIARTPSGHHHMVVQAKAIDPEQDGS